MEPRLDPEIHARRRRRLMRRIGLEGIAILPTAPVCYRNRDADYPYRPDSDFYYLTGFPEPGACLVLAPGHEEGETLLFVRPRDPEQETWTGRRAGVEGAVKTYGADAAYPIDELDRRMPDLLARRRRVYFPLGRDAAFDRRVGDWLNRLREKARSGVHAPTEFIALDHLIHEMRLIKTRPELVLMERAAAITVEAHLRAMAACRPGMREYELEAEYLHTVRRHGAVPAYNPIVAGGENACILHYTANDQPLEAGQLVLIDAGAEFGLYAADVTRTFPVDGRFRPAQRAVYELVLEAQQAAIEQVRPGNHWNAPHEAAARVLTEGLVALGLLEGKVDKLIDEGAYRRFYMHRTGHWLGMDVHDVGEYKTGDDWRELKPGMVLTVEPGLYLDAGRDVPRRYKRIGVRIEDDVVVTRDGCRVLTDQIPKAVADIEALMNP